MDPSPWQRRVTHHGKYMTEHLSLQPIDPDLDSGRTHALHTTSTQTLCNTHLNNRRSVLKQTHSRVQMQEKLLTGVKGG